jgi:hypothetical protein
MITRGELKGQVLRFLNKTSQYRGFYDDDKINDAIQEALDFIAVEMFQAGEGWQTKILLLDTVAGQVTIDIPATISLIKEVRYRYGDIYGVMRYDDASGQSQTAQASGERQWVSTYRVVDNRLYFNPALSEGGPEYLQIEYMAYPKRLSGDMDYLEGHIDPCMTNFLKYQVSTILSASLEKNMVPWAGLQSQWYNKLLTVVGRRNMQPTPIRNFTGGN